MCYLRVGSGLIEGFSGPIIRNEIIGNEISSIAANGPKFNLTHSPL
jgi:hypothetical protein